MCVRACVGVCFKKPKRERQGESTKIVEVERHRAKMAITISWKMTSEFSRATSHQGLVNGVVRTVSVDLTCAFSVTAC